jgi:hypothetical protein
MKNGIDGMTVMPGFKLLISRSHLASIRTARQPLLTPDEW